MGVKRMNYIYQDLFRVSQPTFTIVNDLPQSITVSFEYTFDIPVSIQLVNIGGQAIFTPPTLPTGQERKGIIIRVGVSVLRMGHSTSMTCWKRESYSNQTPNIVYNASEIVFPTGTEKNCR